MNEGIVEAHLHGILTATTLMANGGAAGNTQLNSLATPSLDVGCHLVLVQGSSVLDPSRALPESPRALALAVLAGRIPVYEEMAAQVRKIVAAGIAPTHLDTHKHTHVLPPVLSAMARVAREFGIPWLRRRLKFARPIAGLRMTDRFEGFRETGSLDESH